MIPMIFGKFYDCYAGKIVPILEKYGVDLVLCGHSHVYERSYLINKHYGNSASFNRNTMLIDSSSGNRIATEPT